LAFAQAVELPAGEDLLSGMIAGRVCDDRNGDGSCSADEPGVVGARVVLADGAFAVTDSEGRYHLSAVPSRRSVLSRSSSGSPVAREGLGRHVVRVDTASLEGGTLPRPERRTIDLGAAQLAVQDFAVSSEVAGELGTLPLAPEIPPRGGVARGRFSYQVSFQTPPGHVVHVGDGPDESVVAGGLVRSRVALQAGANVVGISDLSPTGELRFMTQEVSVVVRPAGGVLFVPGPVRAVATVRLPPPDGAPTGAIAVPFRAVRGARLRLSGKEVGTDARGHGQAAMTLVHGTQTQAVEFVLEGGRSIRREVAFAARPRAFAMGQLGVEVGFDPRNRELSGQGRGAGHVRATVGSTEIVAGMDLDAADAASLLMTRADAAGAALPRDGFLLLRPRSPLSVERALDPELHPPEAADASLAGALNPAHARLFARAVAKGVGTAQVGSFHADLSGSEVGRYARSLFGGAAEGQLPVGPFSLRGKVFGAPHAAPLGEPQPMPAHDELLGTGGSLFYLRRGAVLPGSEKIRIEVRDGATALPLDERALVRGVDYEIDYRAGRILLSRPLPIAGDAGPFVSGPVMGSHRNVLIVDYEVRALEAPRNQVLGARAGVEVGPARISMSAVQERRLDLGDSGTYRLLSAHGRARFGPLLLVAETARSEGSLFLPAGTGGFALSDSGGLSFIEAVPALSQSPATAATVRAVLAHDAYGAQAWLRTQEAGFSDSSHGARGSARQVGGRGRFSLGPVEVTAFADDRLAPDPRDPLGPTTVASRDALLRARLTHEDWAIAVEARGASLGAAPALGEREERGARAGVGARVDYAVVPELSLNASHHQRVASFGLGLGSRDETFSAVGASYRPKDDLGLSIRGGWGPVAGAQIQAGAERTGKEEIAYGTTTFDVDGPDAGRLTAVSGARRRVEESAEVFAEELFARDINALRMGRAVGVSFAPAQRFTIRGRYERGVLAQLAGAPGILRDSGSARASLLLAGIRLGALAEVRRERGSGLSGAVDRFQALAGLSVEARPFPFVGLSSRLNFSRTVGPASIEAELFEWTAGAALRLSPWMVVARYSRLVELPPLERRLRGQERVQLLSLQPALEPGSRFRLGAGLHAAFNGSGGEAANLVSFSVRPAMKLVGDVELAIEAARRSAAPDGQEVNALRAEVVAFWDGVFGVGVGCNRCGFAGTGGGPDEGRTDRVYVRAEAAY
jgi:hypothetical protein